MEAQMIQQQAPPSYGQLIAQGIIPPVEDFPTESPNEVREQDNTHHICLVSTFVLDLIKLLKQFQLMIT